MNSSIEPAVYIEEISRQAAPVVDLLAGPYAPWVGTAAATALIALAIVIRRMPRPDRDGQTKDPAEVEHGLVKAGVEDWERPFRLLAERRQWRRMPEPFLWELVSRLNGSPSTIALIEFAERRNLVFRHFRKIAETGDPDKGMELLAHFLVSFRWKHDEDRARALEFAKLIEPKEPAIFLRAARDRYRKRQYGQALTLFEAAMELGQQRIETLRHWPEPNESVGQRMRTLEELLQDAARDYMACLDKIPA